MVRGLLVFAFLALAFGLAYHFYALEMFNLVAPKDAGSRQVAQNLSFGSDPRLKLDVYAPSFGAGPWPTLVFVHGGSWSSGNKDAYEFAGRALAAKGFVAILPQYRLHPAHRYPAFVQDTALAIDWATRHAADFGGDAKKVFVSGHSAGGYNVALAVLDKTYLQALGTDATRIKGVALLAAPADFLPLDNPISIDVFGGLSDLPATQPVNYARADAPPFLILHGTADETCMPRNSINLHRRLQEMGGQSQLKLYDGVSHVNIMLALSRPFRNAAPTLQDMAAFFHAL